MTWIGDLILIEVPSENRKSSSDQYCSIAELGGKFCKIFVNQVYKNSGYYSEMLYKGMPTERCAEWMALAMVNELDEVWISEYPGLVTPYLGQYLPDIYRWYSCHLLFFGRNVHMDESYCM